MTKVRLLLTLPLLLVLPFGCSGGKSAPAQVTGKVTYKGAPVPGGSVMFFPATGEGQSYRGTLGADGTYTITDMATGEYTVTVETASVNPKANSQASLYGNQRGHGAGGVGNPEQQKGGNVSPAGKDYTPPEGVAFVQIPPKYSLPTTSGLKATVTKGKNNHPIDLTD